MDLTDEDIIRKCADPRYWIERCLSIVDKSAETKLVPFRFNPVQLDYYGKRTRRDIIVKSRKQGFSTLIQALFLHACLFRPNTRAVIVSHEEGATKRLFGRLKTMLKEAAWNIPVSRNAQGEVVFPATNSSFWIGTAGSKTFGRGDDITHAHLSEVAHYEDPSVETAVQGALVEGAWFVMETTANGAGTPFYEQWMRATRGESGWMPHFYGWWQDAANVRPNVGLVRLTDEEQALKRTFSLSLEQIAWRRWMIGDMAHPELFQQEFPATSTEAFLTSGKMLFDWQALEQMDRTKLPVKWQGHIVDRGREVRLEDDPKGPLMVWRTPDDHAVYLITADAADGIPGAAYSVADVYDARTWEQVAQWRGHVDPKGFAEVLERLGAFYHWAILYPERKYPGNATILKLSEDQYPNIMADPDDPDHLGFDTTEKSKAIYISDGRDAVKNLSIKINSPITISEMRTFCLIDGKAKPQAGCWQDTVITSCKAANTLQRLTMDPERVERVRRNVTRFRDKFGANPQTPVFKSRVV